MAEQGSYKLEKVGARHQATEQEQRHLGQSATIPKIWNLDPNWGDDNITSGAATVYTIGPGSIPHDSVMISFDNDPSWEAQR